MEVEKATGEVTEASEDADSMVAVYEAGVTSEDMEIQAV